MLSHLAAYNFHFQLNKGILSIRLEFKFEPCPWTAPFEKWKIKFELHTQLEVKPTAVHKNWTEALKSLMLISAQNRETFVTIWVVGTC